MNNFNQQVWQALKKIPRGRITTYGELAKSLGKPMAARAVGNACSLNPFAPKAPCHRVVRSDGRLGGYSDGGAKKKIYLLKREGVRIDGRKTVEFKKKIYRFK